MVINDGDADRVRHLKLLGKVVETVVLSMRRVTRTRTSKTQRDTPKTDTREDRYAPQLRHVRAFRSCDAGGALK